MAVPPVVVGLALLILLGESFVGKWLVSKNIQLVFDMKGVVVAQITVNLPFAIIQTMEHYEKIEPRILSVAQTCGATELILFKRIVIPLSKKNIITTWMTLLVQSYGPIWCSGYGSWHCTI